MNKEKQENILEGITFLRIPAKIIHEFPKMNKSEVIMTLYIFQKMLKYNQVYFQVGVSTIAEKEGLSINSLKKGKQEMLKRGIITLIQKGARGRGNVYGLNYGFLASLSNQSILTKEEKQTKDQAKVWLLKWVEKNFNNADYNKQVKQQIRNDRSPSILKMAEYAKAINWLNKTHGEKRIKSPDKFFYSLMIKNADVPADYLKAQKLAIEKEKTIKKQKATEIRQVEKANQVAEQVAKNLSKNEKVALFDYYQWWNNYKKRTGKNKSPTSYEMMGKITKLKDKYKIQETPDLALMKYLKQPSEENLKVDKAIEMIKKF
jgi:hypothetical protein